MPVVSKIGTKENLIADFLSRNFNLKDANDFFLKNNLSSMKSIPLTDDLFEMQADW